MKISKILMLIITGAFLASFITCIIILRQIIFNKRAAFRKEFTMHSAKVNNFESLVIVAPVKARISQGKKCKLEIITPKSSLLKPEIRNINGVLYCEVDSIRNYHDSLWPEIRVTMPEIKELTAENGSEIILGNFTSDSIHVILGNNCRFKGNNNTLKKTALETNGKASIEIVSTF